MPFIDLPYRIEYEALGSVDRSAQTIVMLHHGLGSVSAWRDFPATVADATGLGVVVYSRRGHGRSAPLESTPQPVEFMHRHAARDLPALLRALGIRRPVLLGHSDGASIALLYAAGGVEPAPEGLVLLAPHVFVEPVTLASAGAAQRDFAKGTLRARLARHHEDVDGAFLGWSETWLQPGFRDWSIEADLGRVRCAVTVIQGIDDEFGTVRQVEAIREGVCDAVEIVLLDDCGHSPERDRPQRTLDAVLGHLEGIRDAPAERDRRVSG